MTPRRILVVGSGAREHALCWRLASEPGVERVIVAPGNALMADVAEVRDRVAVSDLAGLVALAARERVDLVVVGPEAPLVAGLADSLAEAGIRCFGPSAAASRLEGSKTFCREICAAAGVPMAEGRAFDDVDSALAFAERLGLPVVVKADGLAAGKGVAVCETLGDVESHLREAIEFGRFGVAGRRLVVESWLEGAEASVIALCDGAVAAILPAARDHKRLLDGDEGPNTGGMGAYSPVADLGAAELTTMADEIFRPVLAEMTRRGHAFRGALFAGLMLTADGPRLLEFNARLGDPETQAILPRLAVPIAPLLAACAEWRLADEAHAAGFDTLVPALPEAAVALTLAADGYPGTPRTADPIDGIDAARAAGALVFGAGVRRQGQDAVLTAGGRVLTVVGRGSDVASAADAAYAAAERITFDGRVMRRDIGRAVAEVAG
jgi:phosphoribosylamine--glycine ligase